MFSNLDYSHYDDIPKKFLHLKNKTFKDWEIPPWNLLIEKNKLLGEGEYGKVYLATWHNTTVVAKVINENVPLEQKNLFIKELDVLTKIHHPNVVQLMGYVSEPFVIVMEYLPNGELLKYVKNNSLSNKKKIEICLDILKALTYLHNRKPFSIVHRDIKPQNIVISPSGTAKLADFGISRILTGESLKKTCSLDKMLNCIKEDDSIYENITCDNEETIINTLHKENYTSKENKILKDENKIQKNELTKFVGSVRYMSPEVKNNEYYDHKIDIWSTGIIFAELFENKRYNKEFYWKKTPKDIKNIIVSHMLRNDPKDRFNARELCNLFLQIRNNIKSYYFF